MHYAFLVLLGAVALLLGWEVEKTRRARGFAARHGLRAVRGSVDMYAPLVGEIRGVSLQLNPERVTVGTRGRESRVVASLEWPSREIGMLQRWKSGWIELSVRSPAGMQRIEMTSPLRDEYELWGSASRQKPWGWLERVEIVRILNGFRALRSIRCLGTSVVVVMKGDLGDVHTMERMWQLLDELVTKE